MMHGTTNIKNAEDVREQGADEDILHKREEGRGEWRRERNEGLVICFPHQMLFGQSNKKEWDGRVISVYGGEERCIQVFGGET